MDHTLLLHPPRTDPMVEGHHGMAQGSRDREEHMVCRYYKSDSYRYVIIISNFTEGHLR